MTKGRDRVWMQFTHTITATWSRAVREQRPAGEAFKELSDAIHALDISASYKADLSARNWGARDLVEALHAEWVLYLDGKPTTREERSQLSLDRYAELRGRFEWRGTGKPFYDDTEPALLATPSLPQPTDATSV
jgi:hypothetical protein